jgi:hypothetical protein
MTRSVVSVKRARAWPPSSRICFSSLASTRAVPLGNEPVDLSQLARDVLMELSAMYPSHPTVDEIDDGVTTTGDGSRATPGPHQPVSNAYVHTPSGTRVWLRVTTRRRAERDRGGRQRSRHGAGRRTACVRALLAGEPGTQWTGQWPRLVDRLRHCRCASRTRRDDDCTWPWNDSSSDASRTTRAYISGRGIALGPSGPHSAKDARKFKVALR